ncbi:unnamed protein product [Sphagnum jensenii]|uniref:Uncharacterized protein n=1 Tax=Sphagnum jensenii TaxID=128206 RepID=A0ABP1BVE2_9BRYO
MDVEREKSAVWGWRNFVAAACRRRRRRRRCCRLTPSPSSSYLSAPEVFSSSRFQSPLSSASGFFDCGSQLLPQLLPQLPSFSVAFLVLNSGQVSAAGGPAGEVCVEDAEVLVVLQEMRKT